MKLSRFSLHQHQHYLIRSLEKTTFIFVRAKLQKRLALSANSKCVSQFTWPKWQTPILCLVSDSSKQKIKLLSYCGLNTNFAVGYVASIDRNGLTSILEYSYFYALSFSRNMTRTCLHVKGQKISEAKLPCSHILKKTNKNLLFLASQGRIRKKLPFEKTVICF